MVSLFDEDSGIVVLGVGSLGCRIVQAGAEDTSVPDCPIRVRWSAAHTQPAELIATGLDKKILLPAIDGAFAARRAQRAVSERAGELQSLVKGRSFVLLVGALSEPMTAAMLPALAEAVAEASDAFVCAVTADPVFTLARQSDIAAGQASADTSAEELRSRVDLFVRLPGTLLAGGLSNCALNALQAQVEKRVLAAVEALLGTLAGPAQAVPALLRERAQVPVQTAVGLGFGSGAAALQDSLSAALRSLYVEEERAPSGGVLAMLTPRAPSVSEAKQLLARVVERTGACEVDVAPCECGFVDETVCMLLLSVPARTNVVALRA